MKPRAPVSRRLREHAPNEGSLESRIGEIIRSMAAPPRLSGESHLRILERLRSSQSKRGERLGMIPRPVFASAVAIAIVLLGIGAHAKIGRMWSAGLSWVREKTQRAERAEQAAAAQPPAHHDSARSMLAATAAALPAPEASRVDPPLAPEQSAAATSRVEPSRGRRPARRASSPSASTEPRAETNAQLAARGGLPEPAASESAPSAAAAEPAPSDPARLSPLVQESRLLATALEKIRTSHDYAGALATLSDYDARFPRGVLRAEATLARLDALMALGRSDGALRLLDSMEIGGPRAVEMLVLRGELRASAGRYREAIGDFDRVLSRKASSRLQERALYGRASCRSRMGDATGSSSDLREYAARFPNGSHSEEVRRKLSPTAE